MRSDAHLCCAYAGRKLQEAYQSLCQSVPVGTPPCVSQRGDSCVCVCVGGGGGREAFLVMQQSLSKLEGTIMNKGKTLD